MLFHFLFYTMYDLFIQHKGTPLHIAAQKGHVSIVQYLITSGANVNAVDHVSVLLVECIYHFSLFRLKLLHYVMVHVMVMDQQQNV